MTSHILTKCSLSFTIELIYSAREHFIANVASLAPYSTREVRGKVPSSPADTGIFGGLNPPKLKYETP